MGGISTVVLGFAGMGGLAAIAWFLTSRSGSKSKIMEAVHKITQKIGQEKVDKIEVKHIDRSLNKDADRLANKAINQSGLKTKID